MGERVTCMWSGRHVNPDHASKIHNRHTVVCVGTNIVLEITTNKMQMIRLSPSAYSSAIVQQQSFHVLFDHPLTLLITRFTMSDRTSSL